MGTSNAARDIEPASFPDATRLLVLGAIGLVALPLVISVPVFIVASRRLRQLDASGVSHSNRDTVLYARRVGLFGTIWWLALIVLYAAILLRPT